MLARKPNDLTTSHVLNDGWANRIKVSVLIFYSLFGSVPQQAGEPFRPRSPLFQEVGRDDAIDEKLRKSLQHQPISTRAAWK